MPASTLHLTFANRLVNEIQSERSWVTEEVVSQKDLVRFGALFHDLPYYEKIHRDLFFGYLGLSFRTHPRGLVQGPERIAHDEPGINVSRGKEGEFRDASYRG